MIKKIKYVILIGILFLIGQNKVYAQGFSCTYQDTIYNRTLYYNLETINSQDTNGTNELFYYDGEDKQNIGLSCSDTSDGCLYSLGVMTRDGALSCIPLYVNTTDGSYSTKYMGEGMPYTEINPSSKNCDYPNCNFYSQGTAEEIKPAFTCQYSNPDGSEQITIERQIIGGSIYFIRGSESILLENTLLNENCQEFYYVESNHSTTIANLDNRFSALKNLCRTFNDHEIKHFCSNGVCTVPDVTCYEASIAEPYSTSTSGCPITDIPEALPIFISNLINLIKILIPILLVIMGMVDFLKAVVASDEKQMKESQNRFIKRVIAAVFIFFVVAIVQFVFGIISTDGKLTGCINCFINGDCVWEKSNETNESNSNSDSGKGDSENNTGNKNERPDGQNTNSGSAEKGDSENNTGNRNERPDGQNTNSGSAEKGDSENNTGNKNNVNSGNKNNGINGGGHGF